MTLENIFKNIIRDEEIAEQFIPKDRRIKTYAWRSDILSKNWILNTFRSDINTIEKYMHQLSFDFNHGDKEFNASSEYVKQAKQVDIALKELRGRMDKLSMLSATIKQ
jgi:hypothetical protein